MNGFKPTFSPGFQPTAANRMTMSPTTMNSQSQGWKQAAPSQESINEVGDAPDQYAGYPDSPEQQASAARGADLRGTLVDAHPTPKVGKLQMDAWQPTYSPGFQATNVNRMTLSPRKMEEMNSKKFQQGLPPVAPEGAPMTPVWEGGSQESQPTQEHQPTYGWSASAYIAPAQERNQAQQQQTFLPALSSPGSIEHLLAPLMGAYDKARNEAIAWRDACIQKDAEIERLKAALQASSQQAQGAPQAQGAQQVTPRKQGVGMVVGKSLNGRRQGGEHVVVLRLTSGGPAEESGMIQANDVIHAIDRVLIGHLSLEEVSNMILGEPSSQVTFEFGRTNPGDMTEQRFYVTLRRRSAGGTAAAGGGMGRGY